MSSKLTALPAVTSSQATDEMYIVRPSEGLNGSHRIINNDLFSIITNNIADKALRFEHAISSGPPPSIIGFGAIALIPETGNPNGYGFFQSINQFPFIRIGNVTGPQYEQHRSAIVNSIPIFDSPDHDSLNDTSLLIEDGQTLSYANDARQIFNPGAINAGINVGIVGSDPTNVTNGDLWYNSTTNRLMTRKNGVTQPVGDMVADGPYSNTARRLIYEGTAPFTTFRAGISVSPSNGSLIYNPNNRQTFSPGATTPGVNVGSVSPDPSTPINGDLWYNSTTNQLFARINGVNVSLGPQPGTPFALPAVTTPLGYHLGDDNTQLQSITIPPNTFKAPGDYANVYMSGTLANNTNPKQVFILTSLDATIQQTPIIDVLGGGQIQEAIPVIGWSVFGKLIWTGAVTRFYFTFNTIFGLNQVASTGVQQAEGNVTQSQSATRDPQGDLQFDPIEIATFARGVDQDDVVQYLTTCEIFVF